MRCPKCGSGNAAGAWVCGRCDFVLDTSFLGDDILNDQSAPSDAPPPSVLTKPVKLDGPSRDELGGDALILGRLDDGEVQSFVSDRTGGFLPVQSDDVVGEAPASVYLGGDVAALLAPTAVLRPTADAASRRSVLSNFEAFVFELIDGRRNLGEVRGRTGLSQGDVRIAAAMLLDKHMIESAHAGAAAAPTSRAADAPAAHAALQTGDHTSALPPTEDETRELPALPPFKDDPEPEPPPPPFDELELRPLPTSPPEPMAAAPEPEPSAAAPVAPGFRPALRAAPLRPIRHTPPPPPKRPAASALAPPAARSELAAPPPSAAAAAATRQRAAEYYELCQKDLREGRPARAFSYARMAADSDPHEEKYQALLRDWHKTAGAAKASDNDPVSAAQQAEAAGNFERAVELLQKACEKFPQSAPLHNRLAVLAATRLKDFRTAYSSAMRSVELEPDNATYKSNMMKILARVESDDQPASGKAGRAGLFGGLLKR